MNMNMPVSGYNPIPWNNKDEHHYYPRHNDRRRRGYPIGGCAGAQYGCCDDGTTAKKYNDDKCNGEVGPII